MATLSSSTRPAAVLVTALALSLACSEEETTAPIEEVLNTSTRSEQSGRWPEDSLAVADVSWRFISIGASGVRGAYSFTLRNERQIAQETFYNLRFVDAADLELDRYPPQVNLSTMVDSVGTRLVSGNFVLGNLATIALANQAEHMEIWASFEPQWHEVVIVSAEPKTGVTGETYVDTLTATGGDGTYAWRVRSGSLPSGLTLSPSGIINGTPAVRAHDLVTFEVASAGFTAWDVVYVIVIDRPQITSSVLSNGRTGIAYSQSLKMTGGGIYSTDVSWSLVSDILPPGLSLTGSGVISGTPSQAGTWTFRVRVTVYGVSDEGDITITIQ